MQKSLPLCCWRPYHAEKSAGKRMASVPCRNLCRRAGVEATMGQTNSTPTDNGSKEKLKNAFEAGGTMRKTHRGRYQALQSTRLPMRCRASTQRAFSFPPILRRLATLPTSHQPLDLRHDPR
eukprot:GHVT01088699.1.p2 GENE.GHVT01088699.1~~GHVT01088699.1.p2  ORF type:complete len:122 (+),score=11.49 GHVT01088699.1:619-984(+)